MGAHKPNKSSSGPLRVCRRSSNTEPRHGRREIQASKLAAASFGTRAGGVDGHPVTRHRLVATFDCAWLGPEKQEAERPRMGSVLAAALQTCSEPWPSPVGGHKRRRHFV
jgi:hypothetical protein